MLKKIVLKAQQAFRSFACFFSAMQGVFGCRACVKQNFDLTQLLMFIGFVARTKRK
jgi:hypothetical protein